MHPEPEEKRVEVRRDTGGYFCPCWLGDMMSGGQYSGSGSKSVSFWVSWIRNRIVPSTSKKTWISTVL